MLGTSNLKISEDVIAVVAGVAAAEVDGVVGMAGSGSGITGVLGKKDNTKGVKVIIGENSAIIDIHLIVNLDHKVTDVAERVQQKVYEEVETMTGMDAIVINVHIDDISVKKAYSQTGRKQ